jgi:nitrite reductase (NADH) small subunit
MTENLFEVGVVSDFSDGTSQVIELDGRDVVVFQSEGEFYAIENDCPHQGGPLGEGKVEGDSVYCPWHGFEFDLETGTHAQMESMCAETFEIIVTDGIVYLVSG